MTSESEFTCRALGSFSSGSYPPEVHFLFELIFVFSLMGCRCFFVSLSGWNHFNELQMFCFWAFSGAVGKYGEQHSTFHNHDHAKMVVGMIVNGDECC